MQVFIFNYFGTCIEINLFQRFIKIYSKLVNNPIDFQIMVLDNNEVISAVISPELCRLLGGYALDEIT